MPLPPAIRATTLRASLALWFCIAPLVHLAADVETVAPSRRSPTRPGPPLGEALDIPTPSLATSVPEPLAPPPAASLVIATPRIETIPPAPTAPVPAESDPNNPPVSNWLEAQIELARRGFSSGSIDGAVGPKTRAALRAFQISRNLQPTGELDTPTRDILRLSAPISAQQTLTVADIARLQPLRPTWLGKSEQTALAHETALEAVAENFRAHPNLIRRLNPSIDWSTVAVDMPLVVPAVERVFPGASAARLRIRLADFALQALDSAGKIIAHFPVSIGREADSRPLGELHVTVAIRDPNYTFDPAVFPESAEGRELGRKLILPPGPNNPVGVAWIGLDRPGYGIHGTPSPERVGRAESHGCFRLANWDARTLLTLAWVGMPVDVEP
ncbi:MAG: L,D-transpeptidase [Opitutaceae bacterium]